MTTAEELAQIAGVPPLGPGDLQPMPPPDPSLAHVTLELTKLIGVVMTREHETRREYVGQILNDLDELKRRMDRLEQTLNDFINSQPQE